MLDKTKIILSVEYTDTISTTFHGMETSLLLRILLKDSRTSTSD